MFDPKAQNFQWPARITACCLLNITHPRTVGEIFVWSNGFIRWRKQFVPSTAQTQQRLLYCWRVRNVNALYVVKRNNRRMTTLRLQPVTHVMHFNPSVLLAVGHVFSSAREDFSCLLLWVHLTALLYLCITHTHVLLTLQSRACNRGRE